MPNWFDVLLFFQSQMPGSDLAFFGVARVTESLEIEMEVQTKTCWTKARMFSDDSALWYIEYPLDDACTVTRAIEQEHYEFLENALLGLIETARV